MGHLFLPLTSLLMSLLVTMTTGQGCQSACCLLGGVCGNAAFDDCPDGTWNYQVPCYPSYRTCCLPNTLPTDKPPSTTKAPPTDKPRTTDLPGNTTRIPGNETYSCGQGPHLSFPAPSPQIVGGTEATPNSWPWMVSLEFDFFGWNDWKHYCGGSLLNEQWILTAAHCIAKSGAPNPKNYRVVLGKHVRDSISSTGYEQVIPVEQLIVHEAYSTRLPGSPFDLALVKMAVPVEFSAQVSPVCLPPVTDEDFLPDDKCYIVGFGDTKGLGKEKVLNEVLIKITPNKVCDEKWVKGSGRVNLIQPEHICAGDGVPGTCNGDSGGPLVCARGTRWVQAGATSFGAAGCTAEGAPDVYTRISVFIKWIEDRIRENSN